MALSHFDEGCEGPVGTTEPHIGLLTSNVHWPDVDAFEDWCFEWIPKAADGTQQPTEGVQP